MAKITNAEDVLKLRELGMSEEEIADYLGVFTSYVKLVIEQKGEQSG